MSSSPPLLPSHKVRLCVRCIPLLHEDLEREIPGAADPSPIYRELVEVDKLMEVDHGHRDQIAQNKRSTFKANRGSLFSTSRGNVNEAGACGRCTKGFSAMRRKAGACAKCEIWVCTTCSSDHSFPVLGWTSKRAVCFECLPEVERMSKQCRNCETDFSRIPMKGFCSDCGTGACMSCMYLYRLKSLGETDIRLICNKCIIPVKEKIAALQASGTPLPLPSPRNTGGGDGTKSTTKRRFFGKK